MVEPSEEVRGDIARIQLYLEDKYGEVLGFKFSDDKKLMLEQWNDQDPISDWEVERNKRICKAQGSGSNLINECK